VSQPVAFVGLGHMGSHMCRNLCSAGFSVTAFDLDPEAVRRAARSGAQAAGSLVDCVTGTGALVTSLPGPPQVEGVLGAAIGLLEPGSLVIDLSTSSLSVGRQLAKAARARKIDFVDAPVAGQTIGAEAGTLSIYAGATKRGFRRALPLLEAIGDPARVFHVGRSGSGYAVKLMLNLTWFVNLVAAAEALCIGAKAGVDLTKLHTALVASPANSVVLERDLRSVLDDGDYDDGFAMKLVCKDLGLAVDLAAEAGVPAELAALVETVHARARSKYGDPAGEMSAVRLYEEAAGLVLRLGG
jgi:3-hydroxyisobutyrate dehydrogenase